MLKQNDFQATHVRASAEEHGTEQLAAGRSGRSAAARYDHGGTPRRHFGKATRLSISGIAALALLGGIVGPAHAEAIDGSTPSITQETTGTTTDPTPPATGESTSQAAAVAPAAAAEAEVARIAAVKASAAKKASADRAAIKKAAAKQKALYKKKAAAQKRAKKRALLKQQRASVVKKRKRIVHYALKQLGDYQDCTRVVERALKHVGKRPGDLGTQVRDYTRLGAYRVSVKHKKLGDILIWPGRHVAVYTGHGKAVHGGWGGSTVKNRNLNVYGKPIVVRYFKAKKPRTLSAHLSTAR